jgi:hypothetical protein
MKQIILIISVLVFSSFQQDTSVKVLGFFSNERSSDGEHSVGYTLHLWQYNGSLIGILSFNQGVIGDQAEGVISNVKYNSASGDISFSTTLDGQAIIFKGKVFPTRISGSFTWGDKVDKNQSLTSCCKDAAIYKNYKTYKEWENMLRQLL